MKAKRKDIRRIVATGAILLAVACYVICGLHHVCMAGHMQHPPYPLGDWLNDGAWVAAMATAA